MLLNCLILKKTSLAEIVTYKMQKQYSKHDFRDFHISDMIETNSYKHLQDMLDKCFHCIYYRIILTNGTRTGVNHP